MRLWIIILIVLLPSIAMAGETDIKGYGEFILRSDIDAYELLGWVEGIYRQHETEDGSTIWTYRKHEKDQEICGYLFDITTTIYVHNGKILRITLGCSDTIEIQNSYLDKGWKKEIKPYTDASIYLVSELAKKYDNRLYLGAYEDEPRYAVNTTHKGRYYDSRTMRSGCASIWEDSREDYIGVVFEYFIGQTEGEMLLDCDLELSYVAGREWDRIISIDSGEISDGSAVKNKL